MMIPLKNPEDIETPFDTVPFWVAMFYPNSPRESASLLHLWNFEASSAALKPTKLLEGELRRVNKATGQGILAGIVATALVTLFEHRPPPSMRKAVKIASEVSDRFIPEDGSSFKISNDKSDVRKSFNRFKNSAHMWAAFNGLGQNKQVLVKSGDINSFLDLVILSSYFENRLSSVGCIRDWDPHQMPLAYADYIHDFRIPDFEPWLVDLLENRFWGEGT